VGAGGAGKGRTVVEPVGEGGEAAFLFEGESLKPSGRTNDLLGDCDASRKPVGFKAERLKLIRPVKPPRTKSMLITSSIEGIDAPSSPSLDFVEQQYGAFDRGLNRHERACFEFFQRLRRRSLPFCESLFVHLGGEKIVEGTGRATGHEKEEELCDGRLSNCSWRVRNESA
jgi:hypothetical protein